MKNVLATRIAIVLAAAFAASAASAADRGFYVGASAGNAFSNLDTAYTYEMTDVSDDDRGFKVFAGYRFTDWLALETGYTDFGTVAGTLNLVCIPEIPCPGRVSQDSRSLSLSALGSIDAGPVNLFVRAGLARWQADRTLHAGISRIDDDAEGTKALVGLGAEWRFSRIALRIEGERQRIGDADFDLVSIGATWTFGK